jgi:hypothetical protein
MLIYCSQLSEKQAAIRRSALEVFIALRHAGLQPSDSEAIRDALEQLEKTENDLSVKDLAHKLRSNLGKRPAEDEPGTA